MPQISPQAERDALPTASLERNFCYQDKDSISSSLGLQAAEPEPDFALSGKLAAESNKVNGVVLLHAEPQEAANPQHRWRLYQFKGGKPFQVRPHAVSVLISLASDEESRRRANPQHRRRLYQCKGGEPFQANLHAFQYHLTMLYHTAANLQHRCRLYQFKGREAFPGEVQPVHKNNRKNLRAFSRSGRRFPSPVGRKDESPVAGRFTPALAGFIHGGSSGSRCS